MLKEHGEIAAFIGGNSIHHVDEYQTRTDQATSSICSPPNIKT
jgi:hypothetical protein